MLTQKLERQQKMLSLFVNAQSQKSMQTNSLPQKASKSEKLKLINLFSSIMAGVGQQRLAKQEPPHLYSLADSEGVTALQVALSFGNYEAAKFLIDREAPYGSSSIKPYRILKLQTKRMTNFAQAYMDKLLENKLPTNNAFWKLQAQHAEKLRGLIHDLNQQAIGLPSDCKLILSGANGATM